MPPHPSPLTADGGTGPADLMLVRRAQQGDRAALDDLLARLACIVRFVYRLNRSLGYGLDAVQLEDVVQQVYLAVWPRLNDFAGTAALESWVYGFCRNCLRAEARKRAHAHRVVQPGLACAEGAQLEARDAGPDRALLLAERLDVLQAELDGLPPAEREAVELRHLEDWSFERIARHKGLPASTIKDRCYRALSKLEARLERRHVIE